MALDKLTNSGLNAVLGTALLTGISGAATTYSTSAVNVAHDGIVRVFAAVAGGATPTTDLNTGVAYVKLIGGGSVANVPGQGCIFLWCIKNDGSTVAVVQGPVSPLDMAGLFLWNAPQFPAIPSDYIPFAYTVIKAGATASASGWLFGTNNWNATGVTESVKNLTTLPARPQVA